MNSVDKITLVMKYLINIRHFSTNVGSLVSTINIDPGVTISKTTSANNSIVLSTYSNSSDVVMGKGPDMTIGTIMNPKIEKLIKKVAKENEIHFS